jgi:hypothetical protein
MGYVNKGLMKYASTVATSVKKERTGQKSREVVGALFDLIYRDLRKIMLHIQQGSNLPEDVKTKTIDSLIRICGYPLDDVHSYQLKITNSDFYLPSGGFRPLVDSPALRKYFAKNKLGDPAFTLVEKDLSRAVKIYSSHQILCRYTKIY